MVQNSQVVPEDSGTGTGPLRMDGTGSMDDYMYHVKSEKEERVNRLSDVVEEHAPDDGRVRWQWDHSADHIPTSDPEWIDYTEADMEIIEQSFQNGATHVRIHAGKATDRYRLKELFLADMVQYDAVTGRVRRIRRLGPDDIFSKIRRRVLGYFDSLANGTARHKSFLKYKDMMTASSTRGGSKVSLTEANSTIKTARSLKCFTIASSGAFFSVQMLAIILNTVVIGFDVDFNGPDATDETRLIFEIINHLFCIFFFVEIVIRFGAMRKEPTCRMALKSMVEDRWFMFDSLLVLFMVVETWLMPLAMMFMSTDNSSQGLGQLSIFRLLRLLRLSRIGRIARLLTVFPEILLMLKSIFAAMRAVICTLFLLVALLYIFAIIFKARCEDTAIKDMFPGIASSMWMLLLNGAFMDDLGGVIPPIYEEDWVLAVLFVLFVFLSNLTVLNMLIGVICEVANEVSQQEQQMSSAKLLKNDLNEFLVCFDMDDNNEMGIEEFEFFVRNPDVRRMLERHDIEPNILLSLKNTLFTDKEAMNEAKHEVVMKCLESGEDAQKLIDQIPILFRSHTLDEMIDIILRFKGGRGNQATMLDIVDLEQTLCSQFAHLEKVTAESHTHRKHSEREHSGHHFYRTDEMEVNASDEKGRMQMDTGSCQSPKAAPLQPRTIQTENLSSGIAVCLNGLEVHQEFNGKVGQLQFKQNKEGNILVKLWDGGKELLIPPQNLQPVTAFSSSSPSSDLCTITDALEKLSRQVAAVEERQKQQDAMLEERLKATTDAILQRLPPVTESITAHAQVLD